MHIEFPYPGYEAIDPVDVPDERLLGVFRPRPMKVDDEQRVLLDGFEQPFGARRLREAVKKEQRVLILVDDATRNTPVARLLPLVLEELHAGGIRDEDIAFIAAVGTHRDMTEDEWRRKLGEAFGKYRTHPHHWLDLEQLHHFGQTSDGTRVTANRLITEFDFVMGIGSIVPHRVKGMSGGAKIMFPGIAGPEMQYRNQWEASMRLSETIMGVPETPMRLRAEEAARLAGLKYIANVVCDVGGQIAGCFTGDPVMAHRVGCELAARCYRLFVPRRADIVLVDAHPADRDFWQSAKGLYAGTMIARKGGIIILVAPNPEGVADNHPNVLEIGYRPHAELVEMVQRGEIEDLVGAAMLADVAQIIDKAQCFIVSPGMTAEQAQRLGMQHARDATQALHMALASQGPEAQVAVVRHGGHALPIVETEHLRGTPPGMWRYETANRR